ncbi:hypothetical protein [Amycolatopsis minnesotensis]|uniref:Uncharacterized protein n=1 Tax=Amycolatopsis minnesotensis TaxID=337894 RepID=A0ABP5EEK1_9PSEU
MTTDDTTRYLCAASHLDRDYADEAIREFLVEPTRPIPPSPGFDSASVLMEAVAARTRRKLRDGALAVLMAIFLYCLWNTVVMWVWVGLALLLCLRRVWTNGGPPRKVLHRVGALLLVVGLLYLVSAFFNRTILTSLFGSSSSRSRRSGYTAFDVESLDLWFGLSALALALAVLVVDRVVVWHLLTRRFGRMSRNQPRPDPLLEERPLRSWSPPSFVREVARHQAHANLPAEYDGVAQLVVHRGYLPFVGSGRVREPWSMVLPLEPGEKPGEVTELTTTSFYRRVREQMTVLQGSTGLAPGMRLRELKIIDAVFASSSELIDHLNEPAAVAYLSSLDSPPNPFLPPQEVEQLRTLPREWSRYYLCFQLETWDRDLVLTTYLHAAVDDSTLYLEWTPCVLTPVAPEYQSIDKLSRSTARAWGQAFGRWLRLPVTVFGRLRHALRLIRPLPADPGMLDADRFGSLRTLREMAAAPDVLEYFQLLDVVRYEKILHSRLIPAISQVLRESGYSAARFERRAAQVVNQVNIHGANYGAFTVGGQVEGALSGATVPSAEEEKTHE